MECISGLNTLGKKRMENREWKIENGKQANRDAYWPILHSSFPVPGFPFSSA